MPTAWSQAAWHGLPLADCLGCLGSCALCYVVKPLAGWADCVLVPAFCGALFVPGFGGVPLCIPVACVQGVRCGLGRPCGVLSTNLLLVASAHHFCCVVLSNVVLCRSNCRRLRRQLWEQLQAARKDVPVVCSMSESEHLDRAAGCWLCCCCAVRFKRVMLCVCALALHAARMMRPSVQGPWVA